MKYEMPLIEIVKFQKENILLDGASSPDNNPENPEPSVPPVDPTDWFG